jgi:hypothetical protein
MPSSVGPNTFGEENLVFGYDLGDVANSYKGEPTTNNFGGSFRDFTGTGYSFFGEWTPNPTSFTKTYYPNLETPIGLGGTRIEESGNAGFHHLSRYGGGDENGLHSLSCFLYPLVAGITDFCIGMLADGTNNIQFNLDTRVITYGGGISNRNAFIRDVPGYPGWLRIGANIEGRAGGWVGCFGYSSYTAYTGMSGGRKAYITGIQYEYKTQPTPFTPGTRSNTQGLIDLTGNSTIDLTNVSFDSNAQMTFDGTDDVINLDTIAFDIGDWTFEAISNSNSELQGIITGGKFQAGLGYFNLYTSGMLLENSTDTAALSTAHLDGSYHHLVGTVDRSARIIRFYVDGELVATNTAWNGTTTTSLSVGIGANRRPNSTTSRFHNGNIPLAKIYNRALTASEIKSNFNAIKGRFNI